MNIFKSLVIFLLTLVSLSVSAQNLTITPNQSLDESNLDGSYLMAVLASETYADATVDPLNVTLNNAPNGTTVNNVIYISTDTCWVYLSFDGTDFDADSTHFSITIAGIELAGGSDLTSDEITITAVLEPATCTIVADSTLEETTLGSRTLSLILANDVFADNIFDMQNFTLNNAPAGVTIDTVTYNTINNATLQLDFDGTDFDTDSTHFSITIAGTELTGAADVTSNELTIYAYIEPGYITINAPQTLYEDSLDGSSINLYVSNDYFADNNLDTANFTINNFPAGVTIDTVIFSDSLNATIILAYDGTDFDTDSTHCSVTVNGTEFFLGNPYTSNELTIYANPETAVLTATPDTLLQEDILDGRMLTLKLNYETFVDDTLDTFNFTLNNFPTGVSIDTLIYESADTAYLYLAFDGTNFDADSTHASITIAGTELTSGDSLESSEFTVYAINDILIQAFQELSDSTTINMPVSVTNAVGTDLIVNVTIDYPDSFSTVITSDYLVDQLIEFKNPLTAGDSIIVALDATTLDTIVAVGGETEFWLSQALSTNQIALINDTDCVWTFTIRGFSESSDSLFFNLFSAKYGEFSDSTKQFLVGNNASNLIVYEPITIDTDPQSTTVCSTYPVTFTVSATSNSTLSYQWRKNGTVITGATGASYTINHTVLADGGNYSCKVSNQYHSETSASATLTINTSPNVALPDTLNLTTDNVTILAATSGYSSYNWSTGSTSNMITIDGNALGVGTYTYWVEVTDNSNGCSITDTCIVIIGFGLYAENNLNKNSVSVYPNPASDIINISFNENISLEILNIQGEILIHKKLYTKTNTNNTIDISELQSGTYIIRINNEHYIYYNKLIIN